MIDFGPTAKIRSVAEIRDAARSEKREADKIAARARCAAYRAAKRQQKGNE